MGAVMSEKELNEIHVRFRNMISGVIYEQNNISSGADKLEGWRDADERSAIRAMFLEIMCRAWVWEVILFNGCDMEKSRDFIVKTVNVMLKREGDSLKDLEF
jgi:hypothetical protein